MKRAKHNLSNNVLLTANMGGLYPIGVTEVIPADSVQHSTHALIRVTPLIAPLMHPVSVRVHHFFVPHRLVWDGWEDFITSGADGKDAQVVPTMPAPATGKTVLDYMGVPPSGSSLNVSELPVRGFNMIYNEWFRDQDLAAERLENDTTIPQVAWEKDYLTTCRPWAQKGDQVTLPLGAAAPVKGIGTATQVFATGPTNVYESGESAATEFASSKFISDAGADTHMYLEEDPDNAGFPAIYADLANATAVNVNEVRKAFALQRYAEARARYGSRYTEYLRYLGVKSSDARLQRPELIGGGRVPLSISEIIQTAPESATPGETAYGVGDMYGHGIAALRSNRYRRFFEEHGYIHSLLSVRPKAIYSEAVDRHWLRSDREDFFQRELQWIGQQEVYNAEAYGSHSSPKGTFGFQDRYAEYRHAQSRVSGEFRDILNYWHMAREFSSEPVLNQSFTDCVPTKRVYSEQTQDDLWIAIQHRMVARRLVSRSAQARVL